MALMVVMQASVTASTGIFPAVVQLSSLDGKGLVINGINNFARSAGTSVSDAGDLNGDGIPDFVIGAPFAFGQNDNNRFAGESYVVFGGSALSVANAVLVLSELNGTNGFVINGISRNDLSGLSVSGAGDFNGDGVDDLLIGAPERFSNGNENAGSTYMVFGGEGVGSSGVLNLDELSAAEALVINGVNRGDRSGSSVSNAGDVNTDGIADVIIGAPNHSPGGRISAGASYVVFGGTGMGDIGVLELSDLNGINGFVINGVDPMDLSGSSVSGAGDIDGVGVDDLLIGSPGRNADGIEGAGAMYVVRGDRAVGSSGVVELSELARDAGFVIKGADRLGNLGVSVSRAGDVNGDGVADIAIGAPRSGGADNRTPTSYVVFGRNNFAGGTRGFSVADLGTRFGFVINSVEQQDSLGFSVSEAGDANGDGIDDLLLGARFANNSAGASYLIFGSRTLGSTGVLNLADLTGDEGVVFEGTDALDRSGFSVSGVGDVNGDGLNDLLIGAPDAEPATAMNRPSLDGVGETYLVFGQRSIRALRCNGRRITVDLNRGEFPTAGDDVILGTPNADIINGFGGNDSICGKGGDDIIDAGPGNDFVTGGPGNDLIRGRAGDDVIRGDGGDDTLIGGSGNDRILGGPGVDGINGGFGNDEIGTGPGATVGTGVYVNGGSGNDFILGGPDRDDIRGGSGRDRVFSLEGDDRINGGAGADDVYGDEGNDVVNGGLGDDNVRGGEGNDIVRGGPGNDSVRGEGGDRDLVVGGDGDDRLFEGFLCKGGAGTDTAAESCERAVSVP